MKTFRFLLIMLLLFPAFVQADQKDKTFGNVTVKNIVSVYDGDTFTCNLNGYPAIIGEKISIRIAGIDTPEIRCSKKQSEAACKRTKQLARTARRLLENQLKRARVVELRNIRRGKYFRILADVFADGKNVADILIKNKLARPYDGGTKSTW